MASDDIFFDLPFGSSNNEQKPTFNSFFPTSKPKGSESPTDTHNWTIFVHTSNNADASTDANVFIQVFGTSGSTGRVELTKQFNSKALFENGNCDRFDLKLNKIGRPLRIKIGHDGSGILPSWHLDKVWDNCQIILVVNAIKN